MTNDRKLPGLMRSARHQRGITSIEYALIASVIGLAVVVGVGALGQANSDLWSSVVAKFLAALGITA
jgi:Flp pilus assembly pilin Flp